MVAPAASVPTTSTTHPVACEKCGEAQISPEWAEYFNEEGLILYLWHCPHCGNQFETEAPAPAEEKSKEEEHVIEEFFTSLLVA